MLSLSSLPPLSLYIHIPWCVKKCPYCDFNSHEQKKQLPEQAYIDALIQDLTEQLPRVWGRRLNSIFIGGGTPSLFTAESFERLLSQVRALIPFNYDIEITLEANPGTAEADKFKGFFDAGINRLSIGVQSFNDNHLKQLGRIHGSSEALKAINMAQAAGFERINIDLMHGLPGQTIKQAMDDLSIGFDSGVTHLSWYQLTLEPNTLFYQKPPKLPSDERLTDIQDQGELLLKENGFNKYEVSAYSKSKNLRSAHNLNYWSFGDYLAIGAGAHGKLTLPAENKIIRYNQFRNPKDYLDSDKPFTNTSKKIAEQDLPLEFMMNAMRLVDGVPANYFLERTGLTQQLIKPQLDQLLAKEMLLIDSQRWRATELGQRFLNDLLDHFMAEALSFGNRITITKID
ncbi:MAG: radical SAM family heme chaperone HemW [Kangiellaceae bacterium]|jgi:oxygen-independent coproporphyrinogen-3 oxidase|nr:radical SAM family heme chaperone HemW [Kangiellaceae bacterium]